jgi:hypothetical protein
MQLLTSVDTLDEVTELEQLLHASGIPVFVQEDFTRENPADRFGSVGFRIHVWLDEQLEDAVRVMKEPTYIAPSAVDVQDFFAKLEDADANAEAAWPEKEENILNWVIGSAAVAFVAWVAYRIFGSA